MIAQRIIALLIGLFWGSIAFVTTVLQYLRDPSKGWSYQVRREKPKCLESEDEWTHNFFTSKSDGRPVNLHYVQAGSGKKPVMLFLHGFPELWFSWRYQLRHFKAKYRVVAMSHRGYGESDKPKGVDRYQLSLLVEDVKQMIKHLGVKNCILVGHDWGAAIAWRVAMDHPQLVSKLIIMNVPHPAAFRSGISFRQFLKSFYIFVFQLPYLPEYWLTRFDLEAIKKLARGNNSDHEEESAYVYHFSQPGAFTGPINFYRAMFHFEDMRKPDTRIVQVPTLIIWGVNDLALSEELADFSTKYCKNVRLEKISDGNHFVQQHRPDEVNRLMTDFL